jgi:hypothetical protein
MENGTILEMDSYEKLVKNDAQFNSFVKSYFQNKNTNIENISNNILILLIYNNLVSFFIEEITQTDGHRKESLKRKISSITNETDPDADPEDDDSNEITKNIIVKEKIENKKVIFDNI